MTINFNLPDQDNVSGTVSAPLGAEHIPSVPAVPSYDGGPMSGPQGKLRGASSPALQSSDRAGRFTIAFASVALLTLAGLTVFAWLR